MASVEKRPDGKWRARYRPVPGGRQIARHFRRKIDAERWLTEQQSRVNRGDWTAPELGRITVNEWAETWLACAAPHVVMSAFLGLPGLHRQRVLRRSKAWIWDFSSMLSTIAFSGGLRYNPTTSVTLATSSGSAENLNEHHCQTT